MPPSEAERSPGSVPSGGEQRSKRNGAQRSWPRLLSRAAERSGVECRGAGTGGRDAHPGGAERAVPSPSHPNGRPQANALPWCIQSALPGPEALKLQSAPGALPEYVRTAFDWQRQCVPGRVGSRADAVRQWCPGAEADCRPWNGRPSAEHRGAADVLQTSRPDTASVLPPDEGRMPYAEAGDGRRGGSRRRGEQVARTPAGSPMAAGVNPASPPASVPRVPGS